MKLGIMLLYQFDEPLVVSNFSAPSVENQLADYISAFVAGAELVEAVLIRSNGEIQTPESISPNRRRIYICFVFNLSIAALDVVFHKEHVIDDYILNDFTRESIYFQKYWSEKGSDFYIVNFFKFRGMMPL